jgi:MYXO-CTERM domain-containing protein
MGLNRSFGLVVATIAACAFATPASAVATARKVLATGDHVPGFGNIGTGGFATLAVTDEGNLIVTASLSDGREGVFLRHERALIPIVTSEEQPGMVMSLARAHRNGTVMVPVVTTVAPTRYAFHVIKPDGEELTVAPPEIDETGKTLCWVNPREAAVNGAGDVAFHAEISHPGHTCYSHERDASIYVAKGTVAPTVFTTAADSPHRINCNSSSIIGLADDGTLLVGCGSTPYDAASSILTVHDGRVRRIVSSGDPGPSGNPLSSPTRIVANSDGDVAFIAAEGGVGGLYRTDAGSIVTLASPLLSPRGTTYRDPLITALGFAGEVAILAYWSTAPEDPNQTQGLALHTPGNAPETLLLAGRNTGFGTYAAPLGNVAIDTAGGVAFDVRAVGGTSSRTALYRSNDGLEVRLASGDPGPDGTVVAATGLDWDAHHRCLAPDGRLAVVASSTAGHKGILCVDADGAHLVVQSGRPAPDGYTFNDFSACTFTDDGGLIFSGERAVPRYGDDRLVSDLGVYRVDAGGFSKLFNDGDLVSNGTTIEYDGSNVDFAANVRGTVLARARAGGDTGLFMTRDGQLDVVTFNPGVQWALSDDDEVVILRRVDDWSPPSSIRDDFPPGNAIVVFSGRQSRVVLRSDDTRFGGSALNRFTGMKVRGRLVFFELAAEREQSNRVFSYRWGDDTLREIPVTAAAEIVDGTPDGRVLERSAEGEYAVIDLDGIRRVVERDSPDLEPFALNDRGNVGLRSYAHPDGSTYQLYQLTGDAPVESARCPQPDPSAPSTPAPTPAATPEPIVGDGPFRAYVIERGNDTLTAIDTTTQTVLRSGPISHRPLTLAVSPDGSRVFVASESRIDIVEASTLHVIQSIGVGDWIDSIVPADDNVSALAAVSNSKKGLGRLIHVDGAAGIVHSVLTESGTFIGYGSGSTFMAVRNNGAPCDSQGSLFAVDLSSGATLRRITLGTSSPGGSVYGSHAYVVDGCDDVLRAVDLQGLSITAAFPLAQQARDLVLGPDGRAYTTHSHATRPQNSDISYGSLSVVDPGSGALQVVQIPGGMTDSIAVTPDNRLLYVTAGGGVVVVDRETLEVLTRIALHGAFKVATGPAPSPAHPTPASPPSRIIVRAQNARGVPADEVDISVGIEGDESLRVDVLEHTLMTTWNAPMYALYKDEPDCRVDENVDATATFEFDSICSSYSCDQVHVRLVAAPGTSLPFGVPLFRCSVRMSNRIFGPAPLFVLDVRAADATGTVLPAVGADAELYTVYRDDATRLPTRTRPPTLTRTPTPTATPSSTATATRTPVLLEIGFASVVAGSRGSVDVVLHSRAEAVAATQNDIGFASSAPIAAKASGAPACTVNPAIDKADSHFAFQPFGCEVAAGECYAVRALILAFQNVAEIPDGSVLYTCTVEGVAPGDFALSGSGAVVSDMRGRPLPVDIRDGRVTVERVDADSPTPSATETATAMPLPTDTPGPTDGNPASTPVAAEAPHDASGSSGSAGCSMAPEPGSDVWMLGLVGVFFAGRCRRRRVTSP